MRRIKLSLFGVLTLALIFTACGDPENESQVRDAVEEVVTKDFKIYESTKKSLEDIQKASHQNRQKELDLLK